MSEQNKALVRRFYEEVFKKKNVTAVEEYFSPSVVIHAAPPEFPQGVEGAKQLIGMFLLAFPDMDFTIEDLIAEGDKVVNHFTWRATHKGDFMGIAPTEKRVTVSGMEILRVAQGKFVEDWDSFDQLGLMQQLGAVTLPGQAVE